MDQIRRDSDFEPLPDLHGRLINLLQEARDASIFQLDSIYIQGYRPIPPSKPAIKTPKDTAPVEYLFDNN